MSGPKNELAEKLSKSGKQIRGTVEMIFLSDGSIEFDATGVGMMDLWAGSHFLRVQGDAVYVQGMRAMQDNNSKPNLVIARDLPEAKN